MALATIKNTTVAASRIPRASSVHRVACFALYRALLKQCQRVPLPDDLSSRGPVNPLRHLVRKGFRRHVRLTSPALVKDALEVGYNAEKLLRTAGNGNPTVIAQVHSILSILEHRRAMSASQPRPTRKERPRVWPYSSAAKVLDMRPLPKEALSANRHVPKITESMGFALLRFKKPQSPFLSRVIRNKHKAQHKRMELNRRMADVAEVAQIEDTWEEIVVEKVLDEVPEGEREWLAKEGRGWGMLDRGWSREYLLASQQAKSIWQSEMDRSIDHGQRMVKILEEEKVLWKKEKNERRRARTGRWPSSKRQDQNQSVDASHGEVESIQNALEEDMTSNEMGEESTAKQSHAAERLVSFRSMGPRAHR